MEILHPQNHRPKSVQQMKNVLLAEKIVYPMEKLSAEGKVFISHNSIINNLSSYIFLIGFIKVYHKTCFKCSSGGCQLKLGNYAALDGKLFCKPHFKVF